MNLSILFSTPEREAIMNYLLDNPNKEINMNQIARELRVSPGQVHKYISILRQEKLVKEKKLETHPFINSLRLARNLIKLEKNFLIRFLQKNFRNVDGIGLYGTWAHGTNEETSDLDLWVKTSVIPKDIDAAKIRQELEKKFKVPVDIIFLTKEKIKKLREKNDSFYFSLYHSIILWGEGL